MLKTQRGKGCLILLIFCFLFFHILPMDAFARVGGGRSSGYRGSRSSTPPRSYQAPRPSQPSASPQQASPQPLQQPRSGLWGGLAGGIMGGLLGGMLFRSLGFGSDFGGEGSGIGLFDILIICALLYGVYWFFKKRRQAALQNGYYQSSTEMADPRYQPSYAPAYEPQREEGSDTGKGLGYIRQMDPSFDEKKFQDLCMDHFFKTQGAWSNREISGIRNLFTDEMFRVIQDDGEKLRLERKINKLENIAVRSVDIIEAWQETGKDYITVRFYANLLDYTVDETTGQVISGSKTDPVKFEEYWTFARPVGNHPWQLSAINQAE